MNRDVQGAAFCLPENIEGGPFSPHLVLVLKIQEQMILTIKAITEPTTGSIGLDKELTTTVLPLEDFDKVNLEAPTLAMGHFPDVIVCSLGNIICCLVRSKGALFAYELHGSELKKIAQEQIGHYVVDAVMRYSAIEGGAEIVMLLSDNENQKDGRISSYYFRASV